MADITASMVKELREATSLGMMECKKALTKQVATLKQPKNCCASRAVPRPARQPGGWPQKGW